MKIRILWCCVALLLAAGSLFLFAQATLETTFVLPPKGVFSATTLSAPGLTAGYAIVSSLSQLTGMSVLESRQGGVLVTQAAIPIDRGHVVGRFYARIEGNMTACVAIANPFYGELPIQYDVRDMNGVLIKSGSFSVATNRQLAAFLNAPPFNINGPFEGTVEFNAQGNAYITPFRVLRNERGEALFTPVPVTDNSFFGTGFYIPHFVDGGGWNTEVVLVNPTDNDLSGTVAWSDSVGAPAQLTVNGATGASFSYSVRARGVARLATSGTATDIQTGVVSIFGGGSFTQAAMPMIVYTYRRNGITVTETSTSPRVPPYGTSAYFYAEESGDMSQPENLPHQTALAIFNAASTAPVIVKVELIRPDGSTSGTGSLTLRSGEKTSLFLTQVPGLESLQLPFAGMAVVSAPDSKALHVLALRGTYNERGDFLLSTTPVVLRGPIDLPPFTWSGTVFPHFAFGSGFTTQFVLYGSDFVDRNGQPGPGVAGSMTFVKQNGTILTPPMR